MSVSWSYKKFIIFLFFIVHLITNLYLFEVVKNGCYGTNITPTFQNSYIQHLS